MHAYGTLQWNRGLFTSSITTTEVYSSLREMVWVYRSFVRQTTFFFCSFGIIIVGSFIRKTHIIMPSHRFWLQWKTQFNHRFCDRYGNRIVSGLVMDNDRASLFLSIKLSSFIQWMFFVLCPSVCTICCTKYWMKVNEWIMTPHLYGSSSIHNQWDAPGYKPILTMSWKVHYQ